MTPSQYIHETMPIQAVGAPLESATSAMILLHGRGSSADDILSLADDLPLEGMIYIAPQAYGHTWYPYRFIEPVERNEPHLTSALNTVDQIVKRVQEKTGLPASKLVLAGFSQGACLASEYAARNAQRYGGLLVFSGGLIGPEIDPARYSGSLAQTPVFVGCDAQDFHIPLERVQATTTQLKAMGADVTERIYRNLGHTIHQDEIEMAKSILKTLQA